MENHQQQQQQKKREKDVEKGIEGEAKLRQENYKGDQPLPTNSPYSSQNSPSSSSSSPSHEFSFTISLNSSNSSTSFNTRNSKFPPPSLEVDLSPADDIFFHGHLLPLHLLSHLSSSPRASADSMDNFTLPIRELLEEDEDPNKDDGNNNNGEGNNKGTKGEGNNNKSKFTFSLFGLTKGLKGSKVRDREDRENKHKKKKRKFHVIHAMKKYLKMVHPLVLFRGRRENFRLNGKKCSYSYTSGNVTPRNKQDLRGYWSGQYSSAPASMRTSPTNSGLLVATSAIPYASESTMEELQAAIQAAIAHCKNSIAKEEKLKC